jgi:hypothetical protein
MPRTVKPTLYDLSGKRVKDLLWQSRVRKAKDGRELTRFLSLMNRLLAPKYSRGESGAGGLYGSRSSQQRCVVKLRIGKTMKAHQKFLAEYLPQKNKDAVTEKPELFGPEHTGGKAVSEYEKTMTGKHFKFIISPESQRVDTKALVRTLVKRMEAATGKHFTWVAAEHTDTAHKHAHLLINGVDTNGQELFFDRVFLTQTIREMSRQICTSMIGTRTREEIQQSIAGTYKAYRYTFIDETIKNTERPYEGEGGNFESRVTAAGGLEYKRLVFLSGLGLAEQDASIKSRFYLEKNWKSHLKWMGRYNSYLDARKSLLYSGKTSLDLFTADTGPVEGTVTKLYKMNDEDSWNHALLIENKKIGKAWYVPLYFEPSARFLNAHIQCIPEKNSAGLTRPKIMFTTHTHTGVEQ